LPPLTPEARQYLRKEYPHNHTYAVRFGRLWPSPSLARRARRIEALYPASVESLVDLSVCKGYFALRAGRSAAQPRVLGIDVNPVAVDLTRALSTHLHLPNVRAEAMRLHELAERIDEFGGPFQTALVINMYQYLFFGGITEPAYYGSHDEIFGMLRQVCSGTLVFSNCVAFERLSGWVGRLAQAQGRAESYTEETIRRAAERHFSIQEHGMLGSRPLWKLTATQLGEAQS
jgi:hypothetical protein